MKRWLSILAAAGLLLSPIAAVAEDTESQTSQEGVPPVAQTLVREGDFAIKLAADLDLGKPTDEATAENMLATAGVAPANGWISDYPVTPQIIGQLDDAIAKAAADGRLKMSGQEAAKGLHRLVAELNLPEPAGNETAPSSAAPANPAVINNYYYDTGPPIITYYPPPVDYVYLYDWVPYPVFWFGFWFPGFFICHNFTTTVFVRQPVLSVSARLRAIVSNRFIDPVTGRVVAVDPVVRTGTGAVRPMTTLRGAGGRSFMTLADMRHGTALGGVGPVRTGTGFRKRAGRPESFGSPEARRGANAIFSRSVHAMNSRTGIARGNGRMNRQPWRGPGRVSGSSMMRGSGGSGFTAPGRVRNFNGSGFTAHGGPVRAYNGPGFAAPGGLRHTFSGPVLKNGRGSAPWFANRGHWGG